MTLWHKDYLELVIFKRSSEIQVRVTLCQQYYIYNGSLHVSEFHPGGPGGQDDSKSLEILIGGEGNLQL